MSLLDEAKALVAKAEELGEEGKAAVLAEIEEAVAWVKSELGGGGDDPASDAEPPAGVQGVQGAVDAQGEQGVASTDSTGAQGTTTA